MGKTNIPRSYIDLKQEGERIEFSMPSDFLCGQLLRTLIATKPGGRFLELGTGIGLSLAWMVDGMDDNSSLLSIDNDAKLTNIVSRYFHTDSRVNITCEDGGAWLKNYSGDGFDLIFADTWPGKYWNIQKALQLVNPGGIYVVDDMLPQKNWPDDHEQKAADLTKFLENLEQFNTTVLHWSTGIIISSKTHNLN